MMKKITYLLLTILTVSLGYSQTELLNLSFDAPGSENIWIPIADAAAKPGEVNIAYNANGNGSGATELTGVNADGLGGRAYIFRYNNAAFDFGTSGTVSISMDLKIDAELVGTNLVLETQVSKVGGGVVAVPHNNVQLDVPVGGGWTTVTFDMTPNPAEFNNGGTELYFFFNMAAGAFVGAGGTILVDNIVVTGFPPAAPTCSDGIKNGDETGVDCGGPDCLACPTPPNTPAPTPPARAAADVVNLYSGAYAGSQSLTGTNFGVGSNTSTWSEETVSGDSYWAIENSGNDFVGFNFASAVDASQMTHFHMDYWTIGQPTGGVINVKLSNHSGGFLTGETQSGTYLAIPGTDGQWNSIDVEISQFTIGASGGGIIAPTSSRAVLSQMVLIASGASAALFGNIYFDNVYFHKNTTLGIEDFDKTSFSAYPNPTQDSWTVKTKNVNISSVQVYDILGKNVLSLSPNVSEVKIDATKLSKGLYFATVRTEAGSESLKLIKN